MKTQLVSTQGARAGSVLLGTGMTNKGLRLRIMQDQERGMEGPIRGDFIILDPGDNQRADALRPLVNRPTTADELLRVMRQHHPGCVSVVNVHVLAPEHAEAS